MGFLASILILTLFLKSNLGQTSIPNSDELFISSFLDKMGANSSSFSRFSPLCSWQVVLCDENQENVIGILASNLGLTGPIPHSTIANLKNLQFLDLNSNQISGFSSDFWGLTSLKTLNLSMNRFSVNLPNDIANLKNLEKLDLSLNNFTGSIPTIAKLKNLQFLDLSSNQITGFSSDFWGLASLKSLNLSHNRFSVNLSTSIASLKNLEKLDLSLNNFTGPIPDSTIGKLKNLQFLDLSSNQITDFSSDFWGLASLKSLNLSHNRFSVNLPSSIANLSNLEKLDLSFNNFTGPLPDSFTSLTNLQVLNLNQNGFDSIIPLGVIKLQSLISIDLSVNGFHGNLPQHFHSSFLKLKRLNLAVNGLSGRGFDFSKMESLTYLNLSKNLFKGSVVEMLKMPLKVVDLSRNQFEGHLSKVNPNLVYLDLSDNQISGVISSDFITDLAKTHVIKHLNLANNRFSSQDFSQINHLFSLEYLNLSKTSLIGPISDEILSLTRLKTLDLSGNRLAGKLPFFSFKTLQNLDLSNNNLTGDIPLVMLQKLPWMESFNFSYNNLTLCNLEFSIQRFESAFVGCSNSCPIAANPTLFRRKPRSRRGFGLALALAVALGSLLVALLILAVGCQRKTRMLDVKNRLCKEDRVGCGGSGPFSFKTDSTTWVADVKVASLVPVVIFEKPLLNLTFADLLSATSRFDRDTLLAEGRFGPVYRGFLGGGVHVAIKVLVHGSMMTDDEAVTELEYLGRVKHPNLVPLLGYCLAGEQRIAIYDYMENGNLHNLLYDLPLSVRVDEDWNTDTWEHEPDTETAIQTTGSEPLLLTWRFRHTIALGTARALAFLHHGCSPPIIHRDVKASSVYLDYDLKPRLSDSGLAKIFGNNINDENTPGYASPDDTITTKSDVYGFGVILLELITGKKPVGDEYPHDDNSKEPNLVSWVRGLVRVNRGSRAIDPKIRATGDEDQMVEGLKIGYLCTADLPSKRPSMQQVVGLLKDIEPVRANEDG